MRAMIMAVVVAAGLAISGTAANADSKTDPTVVVTDQPGAPRDMLNQLEKLTGSSLGTVDRVMAVDAGGARLTSKEVEALAAGAGVDGVKVLGVMPASLDILDTTMTDLSDGTYDGPRDIGESTATLIFASYIPEGREWCLTMCMSTGRTLHECVMLSRR